MKRILTHTLLVLFLLAFSMNNGGSASAQGPVRGTRGLSSGPGIRPYRGVPVYYRPPVYRFRSFASVYRPFYHYAPWLGFRFRALPWGYVTVHYGPNIFYYYDGLFYRNFRDYYEVVPPPVGAEVPALPAGAKEVHINGQVYYEKNGVYYRRVGSEDDKESYVVAGKDGDFSTDTTDVKEGDIIERLPEDSRKVVINGLDYYLAPNGFYYQETVDGDKKTYRVVGSTGKK
ncbi:DUF6515 family protein [Arcticibacter sp. MXS-1]|uniref:DUF6515 family protein n=1 Tax=Arcticibacter sp. MXS-1 TaxID=3341726 RepID=UPI0035A98FD7